MVFSLTRSVQVALLILEVIAVVVGGGGGCGDWDCGMI